MRWLISERGSDAAVALRQLNVPRLAPRLMLVAAASAMRRKVSGGQITSTEASLALRGLAGAVRAHVIRLAADEDFIAGAVGVVAGAAA